MNDLSNFMFRPFVIRKNLLLVWLPLRNRFVVLSAEPFKVTLTYHDVFGGKHANIDDYHSHTDE